MAKEMTKEQEEEREKIIKALTNQLRVRSFTIEYKVVKKPKGIKIIYEVTKEQLEAAMERAAKREADQTADD